MEDFVNFQQGSDLERTVKDLQLNVYKSSEDAIRKMIPKLS